MLRAAALVAPSSIEVVLYEEIETLPLFNPDLDIEPGPEGVWRYRAALRDASAVIFSTPEYARGIPGSLKNALDWVVGSGELSGKPVALMNASARGEFAQAALREVLKTMDARLVSGAEVTVPLPGMGLGAREIAADPEFADLIRVSLQTIAAVSRVANPEEREQMQGQRQKQIPAG